MQGNYPMALKTFAPPPQIRTARETAARCTDSTQNSTPNPPSKIHITSNLKESLDQYFLQTLSMSLQFLSMYTLVRKVTFLSEL